MVIYAGPSACQARGRAGFDRSLLRPSPDPGPACPHPAENASPRPRPIEKGAGSTLPRTSTETVCGGALPGVTTDGTTYQPWWPVRRGFDLPAANGRCTRPLVPHRQEGSLRGRSLGEPAAEVHGPRLSQRAGEGQQGRPGSGQEGLLVDFQRHRGAARRGGSDGGPGTGDPVRREV